MDEVNRNDIGNIMDHGEVIVYEIKREHTSLKDSEQLDELKRNDDLFFQCQHFIADGECVKLYMKRNQSYQNIRHSQEKPVDLKIIIAKNLLKLNRLIGTQYTTILHPDNVYFNEKGDIKLVYRGIRHVLPPFDFNREHLLNELKEILIYLYMGYSTYLNNSNPLNAKTEPYITKIKQAGNLQQLQQIIENRKKKNDHYTAQDEKKITNDFNKTVRPKKPKQKISLLSGTLIGFLGGLLVLYVTQVIPLTKEATQIEDAFQEEKNILVVENEELQQQLSQSESVQQAFQSAHEGEIEEAIRLLESLESLSTRNQDFLSSLYLESNNPEYLLKAANLDEENHSLVAAKLVELDNAEAINVLVNMESEEPIILIEKAWIDENYEEVLEIYPKVEKSNRAKLLAARSYLAVNQPEEALTLGEELNDISIQISSLEQQVELVEADDNLDDDVREEILEELNQELEERAK